MESKIQIYYCSIYCMSQWSSGIHYSSKVYKILHLAFTLVFSKRVQREPRIKKLQLTHSAVYNIWWVDGPKSQWWIYKVRFYVNRKYQWQPAASCGDMPISYVIVYMHSLYILKYSAVPSYQHSLHFNSSTKRF